jgi:small subunit ribosomal protein S6
MRKHHYESAVIINAALEDEQIDSIINKLKDTITVNGGVITEVDVWGRKRLAYQIKKSKIGYYVIFQFEAPVSAIAQIERVYRLEESILRFLTIQLSKFALEYFSDQKQKAAAAQLSEIPLEVAVPEEAAAATEVKVETENPADKG